MLVVYTCSKVFNHCFDNQIIIKTKFAFFFSPSIRISGKNIIFNDKKISKSDFYKNKKLSRMENIDVNKILISKKESFGKKSSFKYFI